MGIIYTDHAEGRVAKRLIKKEWIESALNKPDRLIDAKGGRKQAIKKINGEEISVIFVKENETFIVVTVFWGE